MPLFSFDSKKTFKPVKTHKAGHKAKDLHHYAKATLGTGDMRGAVKLPEHEDLNEWLAVHTVDFYNEVSLLFGTISEFCTAESCPTMSAGAKYEYLWADGVKVTKPVKLTAAEYVDALMTWIEGQVNSEAIFPTSTDVPFPKNFPIVVKNIFKRLFRVYGHIYHHHFEKIVELSAEAHLNTCFKHFIYFVREFDLVDERELAPMAELIEELVPPKATGGTAALAGVAEGDGF